MATHIVIRTLIAEDEPLARQTLRDFIDETAWLEFVGEAADGLTAICLIDDLKPDLVLLDVCLPELSGLEVLRRIKHKPTVIFTTAYDSYAVPAFELEALDYLLKPFGRARFTLAMERARRRLVHANASPIVLPESEFSAAIPDLSTPLARLFVPDARGRIVGLHVDEVSHLTADDDYVSVHTRGKSYLVNLTLNDFERRLDSTCFVRVHRSAIVNLDHVKVIEPHDRRLLLRLRDGLQVLASRSGSQALKDRIA